MLTAVQVADAESDARRLAEDQAAEHLRANKILATEFANTRSRLLEQNRLKQRSFDSNVVLAEQLQNLQQQLVDQCSLCEAQQAARTSAEEYLRDERLNVLTMGRHLSSEVQQRLAAHLRSSAMSALVCREAAEATAASAEEVRNELEQVVRVEKDRRVVAEGAVEEAVVSRKLMQEALNKESANVTALQRSLAEATEQLELEHHEYLKREAQLCDSLEQDSAQINQLQAQLVNAQSAVAALAEQCKVLEAERDGTCSELEELRGEAERETQRLGEELESAQRELQQMSEALSQAKEEQVRLTETSRDHQDTIVRMEQEARDQVRTS